MSDKYELFLDRDKKVKIAADEEGNFFAEANGNRVKLGDSGLQKFGEGGVLEEVGERTDFLVVPFKAKGFNTRFLDLENPSYQSYFPGKNDAYSFDTGIGGMSGFNKAVNEALDFALSKGTRGVMFNMTIDLNIELAYGYKKIYYDDWNSPPTVFIDSSNKVYRLEMVGRTGSINKELGIKQGYEDIDAYDPIDSIPFGGPAYGKPLGVHRTYDGPAGDFFNSQAYAYFDDYLKLGFDSPAPEGLDDTLVSVDRISEKIYNNISGGGPNIPLATMLTSSLQLPKAALPYALFGWPYNYTLEYHLHPETVYFPSNTMGGYAYPLYFSSGCNLFGTVTIEIINETY